MSLKDFIDDISPLSLYIGGVGKGSSYSGVVKFQKYINEPCSCAVIVGYDFNVLDVQGGIISQINDIFHDSINYELSTINKKVFKSGATLETLKLVDVGDRQFDYVCIDCACQIDDTYSFDYIKSIALKKTWMSANTENKGIIFKEVRSLFNDVGEYYEFDETKRLKDINVYHGTCLDNEELLKIRPDYIKQLNILPLKLKNTLLYGRYNKD